MSRARAFLLPLILASALPAAARDWRSAPDWFRALTSGDEHMARGAKYYVDAHPAEAFALLVDCLRELPTEARSCVRWLPLAIRTPEDRARAVEAIANLLDAPRGRPEVGDPPEIQAIIAAGKIGPDARILVPRIEARLASLRASGPHQDVIWIARALGRIEPGHPAVVPALEESVFSLSDKWQRTAAIGVLGGLGSAGGAAVAPLRRALAEPDPEIVASAMRALVALGAVAAPAVPDLIARLEATCPDIGPLANQHPSHCSELVYTIGMIEAPEFAYPRRVLARSPSAEARRRALHAFQRMGPQARPARDAIERALASDPEPSVRAAAATALGLLGDPASVPALVAALADPDLRRAALGALGEIGPQASAAREPIERLLLSSRGDAAAAADALAKIGDPACVPALLNAASNRSTRTSALEALGDLGPRAAAARDPLLAMLASDPDPYARSLAASALGKLCDPSTLPALVAALAHERTRSQAARAIGMLGRRAVSARDAVAKAEAGENGRIALLRIDGAAPAPCEPDAKAP